MYPSLSPWLPLCRHFLGKSAHLSNCWFLILTPASPSPLVRYKCAAGHSTYQIRKLVLIQLENNIFSFFWLIFSQTVFWFSFSCSHTNTLCPCNGGDGRRAGTSGWRHVHYRWFKHHYHWAQATVEPALTPGCGLVSVWQCRLLGTLCGPLPIHSATCLQVVTQLHVCLKNDPVKNGYCYNTAGVTHEGYHNSLADSWFKAFRFKAIVSVKVTQSHR